MADDQVKYKDLFDEGIIGEVQKLTNEITSLKDAIAAAKTEANGLRDNLRGAGTATREQQQQTAADAAAVEALNRQVKDLTDKLAKLEERKKRYSKLTDAETASVEALRQALAGSAQDQIKATQAIDMQSKSYNELYQTYNALKDALNRMTVAERENSQAGKEMVNRAKEIRDTLNNLQQATGNYTLNVGNYMSALNGLQFQTQQVLREIPSAQNLSQFFLAISNNIPMFADALARYNQGLPEIKAKLAAVTAEIARQNAAMAAMNVQSTEYAAAQARLNELQRQQQQLQGASVSGWRAVLKAVGSWQTLLIAGLLILRKIPDWVKAIRERWKETHEVVKNVVSAQTALGQLHADVAKKVDDEAAELRLVVDRLQSVKKGTDEWVNGIATVNKITGENLDATTATIEMVDEVTKAYIRQAEQLATNAILTDRIAQSNANQLQRRAAMSATTFEGLEQIMGNLSGNDRARLQSAFNKRQKALRDLERKQAGETVTRQVYETTRTGAIYTNDVEIDEKAIKKELDDATRMMENVINKRFEVLSKDAIDALEAEYDLSSPLLKKKTPKTPREKKEKDPVQDILTMQRMLEDETTANIEDWMEREEQAEIERHTRFVKDRQAELKLLSADDPRRAIINKRIEEEEETHSRKMLDIAEKRRQELIKQSEQEAAEAEKAEKENAKKLLDAEVQNWEKRRTQMVEQGKTRKEMLEAEFAAEIARLNIMKDLNRDVNGEKMSDEQRQKIEEWIKLLEQLQAAGNFRGIKLGSIFGKGASGLGGEKNKSGNYSNIIDVLFGEKITNEQISALNSVFDQAKEALNSWMDARKAAADQAKELADDEVSAAENALNREIELRNQGYANNVALRERELADAKEKQKQAVEEQKKIAQQQILLDAALQTSSMITASANIIKQFPNPLAWAPMLALMWGTFAYAKTKAYQASTKSIQFREGGVMLLEGGSHESGHDVNLGIGPDGSNLRAEGGEYFAVINKRNSRKYGSEIPAVVNALNSGMFEDRYIKTSDAVGMMGSMGRMCNVGEAVDLSAVESGVGQLVKQGERSWSTEGEYRVMRYKNLTRRVRIG